MNRTGPNRRWRIVGTALLVVLASLPFTLPALAHAELRESSPAAGETVGGAVHSVALQFFDLDVSKPQVAEIFDAAGDPVPHQFNIENQRIVLALVDPITVPGEYLVTFAVNGVDGDFSQESFTFQYEEGAPEPTGISADLTVPTGFDTLNFVLLSVGAAFAAFLAHRFMMALREHRAAQASASHQAVEL